ncbi:unnamed protein product, partial [Prorocentrum cordatum]
MLPRWPWCTSLHYLFFCASFALVPVLSGRYAVEDVCSLIQLHVEGNDHVGFDVVEPRPWSVARKLATRTVAKLTVQERNGLLRGLDLPRDYAGNYIGSTAAVPRLGVPALKMQDSALGFRTTANDTHNTTTCFPSMLALAATWDEETVGQTARMIAEEFRGKGANVILGPEVNVVRTAYGGRNFESLSGEDPHLGARLTRAYVTGAQGAGVITVAKHWAFNEQETNRRNESSQVDSKTAWELYYPPFEAAVEAGAGGFMCSYNKVNDTYACENPELLHRDLRGMMGFSGFVVSDWGATHSTAVTAGLDIVMPVGGEMGYYNDTQLRESPASDVDRAAANVLTAIYRLRLDAHANDALGCEPPACEAPMRSDQMSAQHTAQSLRAATQSITLLKNENETLPLDPRRVKTLAIFGLVAASVQPKFYSGHGSGHINPKAPVTPLQAIQARAEAAGIQVISRTSQEPLAEVLEAASRADVVLVVGGASSREGYDRDNLRLNGDADAIVTACASRRPTVVLMQTPGPVLTPWRNQAAAIANLFLAGEQTGRAWAQVLFGDAEPEGRLPVMFPAGKMDSISPSDKLRISYREQLRTSYRSPRYHAAFPFGHGLSYTRFDYSPLRRCSTAPSGGARRADERACLTLRVANSGRRPGREVVQAYVEFGGAGAAGEPERVLRGFRKTGVLQPGGGEDVTLSQGATPGRSTAVNPRGKDGQPSQGYPCILVPS